MPDIDYIRKKCTERPYMKLGFVVYRLTYEDDAQWARFMNHLNTRTRLNLETDGAGDLFARIDWTVQEGPELVGKTFTDVKRLFQLWVTEHSGKSEEEPWSTRHEACVAVTQFHVESVLRGPVPETFDVHGQGFVHLIPVDQEDTDTAVGLSYLVPRVFSLLRIGWEQVDVGKIGIFHD